jgi:hypothetical protein
LLARSDGLARRVELRGRISVCAVPEAHQPHAVGLDCTPVRPTDAPSESETPTREGDRSCARRYPIERPRWDEGAGCLASAAVSSR